MQKNKNAVTVYRFGKIAYNRLLRDDQLPGWFNSTT